MKRRDVKLLLVLLAVLLLAAAGLTACERAASTAIPAPTPVPTSTATPVPTPTAIPTSAPRPAGDGIVNGWAILAEKNDYKDVEMTDLLVDHISITLLHQRLRDAGWPEDHVRELREFDRDDLRQGLKWLADNADEDDLVLFYAFAHGKFLRQVVRWGDFFPADWAKVRSERRVLVVDACQAALLTTPVNDDPRPHLSIAAVDEDEYGWAGLEEEGLPIIGAVFTHYFAAAFAQPEADTDGNGRVSIQEAARHAEGQQRTYMHEVVFAVPEFVEMYHKFGAYPDKDPDFPHVVVDDTIGEPVYLELKT